MFKGLEFFTSMLWHRSNMVFFHPIRGFSLRNIVTKTTVNFFVSLGVIVLYLNFQVTSKHARITVPFSLSVFKC